MISKKQLWLLGFRQTLAFQSGVFPFGILYATIATAAGFPWWLTLFMSVVVFGGSSQLVYIDLIQSLSTPLQAALGSNIVNARHLIYSAAVSQKFSKFSGAWKLLLSYLLTDQLFAVSQDPKAQAPLAPDHNLPWFYFGSGFCTWIFWQIACGMGIFLGTYVPTSWNLSFSIPLLFLPLIFLVSENKFSYLTCIFSFSFVLLFLDLPLGFGVFISILLSSLFGFFIQKYFKRDT